MRASQRALAVALTAAAASAAPGAARAQGVVGDGVTAFERQVDAVHEVVDGWLDRTGPFGDVVRRVHVGGFASGIHFDAQDDAQLGEPDTELWDARLFVDVDLAGELSLGGRTWLRSAGLSAEWNVYRLGYRDDDLGEAYLELQGLLDSSWANVQAGRFHIPVGEAYLRYGKGTKDNPFVTNGVSGPWWWDEGVKLYGSEAAGRFGYVASVTNGETDRDFGLDDGDQYTLKLWVDPTRWLHLSASALYSGRMGSPEAPANAALWLGETWASGFGSLTPIPSLTDGRVVPAAPSGALDDTTYLGVDAVLTHPAGARLWLSYGSYEIDSDGSSIYDRRLHGWIAELVLEGRLASPVLEPFYVALRANGLGTYDDGRGYLLDIRYGWTFGYDMRALDEYALVVGWRLGRYVTLKAQASFQDVSLVRGTSEMRSAADDAHYVAFALEVHF
jgi:hypothetical protein